MCAELLQRSVNQSCWARRELRTNTQSQTVENSPRQGECSTRCGWCGWWGSGRFSLRSCPVVFGVLSRHFKGPVQCSGLLWSLAVAERISDCISKCLQPWCAQLLQFSGNITAVSDEILPVLICFLPCVTAGAANVLW